MRPVADVIKLEILLIPGSFGLRETRKTFSSSRKRARDTEKTNPEKQLELAVKHANGRRVYLRKRCKHARVPGVLYASVGTDNFNIYEELRAFLP